VAKLSIVVFWIVTSYSFVGGYQRFGERITSIFWTLKDSEEGQSYGITSHKTTMEVTNPLLLGSSVVYTPVYACKLRDLFQNLMITILNKYLICS
jgi:hypothetical protein